jgi:hypothetical protein
VFRSPDGGFSWTSSSLEGCSVSGIAFAPSSPNIGYLVTDFGSAKTSDSGVTWTSTGFFPSCCTRAVSVDPNNTSTVYALSNDGVYKSTNAAATWSLTSGPTFALNSPVQLAVAPTNPATIYAASSVNQSGFVAKLSPTGASILYSTFLDGGGGTTYSSGIAVDNLGSALVAGYTTDAGFPTTPASFKTAKACCTEAFVAKISDSTPACSVTVSRSATTYGAAGTLQDSLAILSPSGCPWTASTAASWIHLVSGISGASLTNSGAGTVFFSVDRNTGSSQRSGTITAGGQSFTITQTAASLVQVLLTPTSTFKQGLHGGTYSIAVSNAPGGGPTAGTIFVQFNSPSGLSLTSMTGTGWSCTGNTCFRSEVLNGGASFPLITVTVDVASNAPDPVVSEASVSGGGTPVTVVSQNITPVSPNPVRFIPVTPCRIADTRDPAGPFGGPIIAGGATRSFTVPNSACGIPASALAYSLNVAAVPAGPLGYLTVWPSGETQPLVSTLNSLDGRTKSNAAVVPAGAGGAISVFASNPTHVVLDINGYFVPATDPNGLAFFPVAPCRIADTRNPAGPLGGPFLTGGVPRAFDILSAPCGIPATARAYALNLAVVPHGALGYLTAWPTGHAQPLVASLNALTGTVTANAAIVPAGTGGSVDLFASNSTDLVIDIDGYFAPMTTGGLSLYNVVPCRLIDTRQPPGSLPFNGVLNVSATASACGIPATAQAHALSATVVPAGPLGYLTIWPQGQAQPAASTLNAVDAAVTSNLAIVQASNGNISVFASNPTHLVLDIFGFFAP